MIPGARVISGLNTRSDRPAGLPPGVDGYVEHMRAHALFLWHPAERDKGHGPGCRTGHWLWGMAEKIDCGLIPLPGLEREDPPAAVPEPPGDWSGVADLADDEYDPEQEDWAS